MRKNAILAAMLLLLLPFVPWWCWHADEQRVPDAWTIIQKLEQGDEKPPAC